MIEDRGSLLLPSVPAKMSASRMTRRSKFALAIWVALSTPCLWAQGGFEGAVSRADFGAPFGPTLAVADFDGDGRADGAALVDSGRRRGQDTFRIELHFTDRANTALTFESSQAFHAVAAWDVDNDGDIDIIVECPFTQERLHVWLNDGEGGFEEGRVEDFPSRAATARERLKLPFPRPYTQALSLPPQRRPDIALLRARRLPGSPSVSGELQVSSIVSSLESCPFAQHAPRAPPPSNFR
jgi:hypothetical protein